MRSERICLIFRVCRIRYAQFREAVAQGVAGEAEGAGGLAFVAIGAAEGFANGFVFPLFERHAGRQDVGGTARGGTLGGIVEINVGGVERGGGGKRDAALDDVLQFADISRPVIVHQSLHRFGRNSGDGFSGFLCVALEKIIGERGNVFLVIAQRRNVDGHDVQAVVEVLAERAFFERGAEVAVGGGDQAHVHLVRFRSAQALELAVLQHAQKLHLNGAGHVADFVEKQRALIGQLEFPRLGSRRAGKRALFVAEEFAFEQEFPESPCC